MGAQSGGGGDPGAARAWHRPGAVLAARPRLPDRRGQARGEYPEGDYRRNDPRYQGENYDANVRAAQVVRDIAAAHAAKPGQVALAWLLNKGDDVVPIPGTKRRTYLEENVAAAALRLSTAQMASLDAALAPEKIAGPRYAAWMMETIDR